MVIQSVKKVASDCKAIFPKEKYHLKNSSQCLEWLKIHKYFAAIWFYLCCGHLWLCVHKMNMANWSLNALKGMDGQLNQIHMHKHICKEKVEDFKRKTLFFQ